LYFGEYSPFTIYYYQQQALLKGFSFLVFSINTQEALFFLKETILASTLYIVYFIISIEQPFIKSYS